MFISKRNWNKVLEEKYPLSSILNPLSSSTRGSTFTFWTKLDENIIHSDFEFVRFNFNSSDHLSFENGSLLRNEELVANTYYAPLSSILYDGKWGMLEFKFDNKPDEGIAFELNCYHMQENDDKQTPVCERLIQGGSTIMSGDIKIDEDAERVLGYPTDDSMFKGCFRNPTIFAGCLTENEALAYFTAGLNEVYDLAEEYKNSSIRKLIESGKFYLGLVGIYEVENINIVNCVMKYNGNSYSVNEK